VRECTTVLDRTGTEARRESARDAPPTVRFYHNKWDNNNYKIETIKHKK